MAKDIGIWSGFGGMELLREDVGSVIPNQSRKQQIDERKIDRLFNLYQKRVP
jgi:hypothetical protein